MTEGERRAAKLVLRIGQIVTSWIVLFVVVGFGPSALTCERPDLPWMIIAAIVAAIGIALLEYSTKRKARRRNSQDD